LILLSAYSKVLNPRGPTQNRNQVGRRSSGRCNSKAEVSPCTTRSWTPTS
jgi:hypothetical protein